MVHELQGHLCVTIPMCYLKLQSLLVLHIRIYKKNTSTPLFVMIIDMLGDATVNICAYIFRKTIYIVYQIPVLLIN